jgi:hypothetical protein
MTDASVATADFADNGWNLNTQTTKNLLNTNRRMVNFSGTFKDITANFGLISSEKGTAEFMFGAGEGHKVHYFSAYGSLAYNKEWNEKISMSLKTDFTTDNHWVDDNFFFANAATNNISRMNAIDIEWNTIFSPSEKLNILTGLNTRYVDNFMILVDYPQFGYNDFEWSSDDVQTFGFFTQLNYQISEKINVIAGFRLENIQPYTVTSIMPYEDRFTVPLMINYSFEPETAFDFVPRLAVVYSINPTNTLKLLYGKAIKQPSITAQFDMFGTNETLKSADIATYEINYQTIVASKVSITTSIFYNQLNDLISRINIVDENDNIYIISRNEGKNTTVGAELGIKFKPCEHFLLDARGIYQKSTDQRKGYENIDLAYSPTFLAYLNAIYTVKKVDFSLSGRFVDKMQTAWNPNYIDENQLPIVADNDIYNGRIGVESPTHFTLSANIRANELFNSGLYINLNMTNLLDEKIYYPTTLSNPQFDKGTLGFGRWVYFSLGYKF